MDDSFDISDLDSMDDAGPTAIESASFDSDGWVSVGRSQGVGGWGGGGWLSGLSAASVASPAPVERGGKDLSDSYEEEDEEEEEEEEEEGGEEVLQYGSDETGIHRQGTYNQWCMIKHNDGSTEVVTMEAGGILVGTTAEVVASHVESTRERGQTALEALQSELGADKLVPMVNGGLNLSKLRSLMHDTVNASHPPLSLCFYLFLSLSKNITL